MNDLRDLVQVLGCLLLALALLLMASGVLVGMWIS